MNYNDGLIHTDIFNKPESELRIIANDFSEGSKELEDCLLEMWKHKLYTSACCRGNHDSIECNKRYNPSNAYILGMENIDFFSYLSSDLISDEMIEINCDDKRQYIGIYGENKYNLIKKMVQDIKTGKKDNKSVIDGKLGKRISPENLLKSFVSEMKYNNYRDDDISKMVPIAREIFVLEYNWDVSKVTEQLIKKHQDYHFELVSLIKLAYENKESKYENNKKTK